LSVCVTVNTVFKAYDAAGQCRADLLRIYPASEEAIRLAAEAERGDR
jgi:hypothetical protein